jgi:hypothetical protein
MFELNLYCTLSFAGFPTIAFFPVQDLSHAPTLHLVVLSLQDKQSFCLFYDLAIDIDIDRYRYRYIWDRVSLRNLLSLNSRSSCLSSVEITGICHYVLLWPWYFEEYWSDVYKCLSLDLFVVFLMIRLRSRSWYSILILALPHAMYTQFLFLSIQMNPSSHWWHPISIEI